MNYDFSSLSHNDFENLARDLIGREIGVRFEAFPEGPDDGMDGRHAAAEGSVVLQAKHYHRSGFSRLKSKMAQERVSIDRLQAKRYILATSTPLTPGNKTALAGTIGPSLQTPGDIFGPDDLNALLRKHPDIEKAHHKLWVSLQVEHFHEPELEFAFSQRSPHPKDGLFLYGPHGNSKKTREIRLGIVGTTQGIGLFRAWSYKLRKVVQVPPPRKGEKADRLHLTNFPGLEETFGISFDPDECSSLSIPLQDIDRATRVVNLNEAVEKVARLYIDRVKKHLRNEEQSVDVWVLVLPEIVYERCRPGSKRTGLPMEKWPAAGFSDTRLS